MAVTPTKHGTVNHCIH